MQNYIFLFLFLVDGAIVFNFVVVVSQI